VAVVSPLVRRLARDAGLDLAAIRGSGRDGLITRRDVDAAIAAAAAPVQPAGGRPAEPDRSHGPGLPSVPGGGAAGTVRIPLRGSRKTAADKLSRSRREIPEATVWVDVDATELVALRATLNADESVPKISLLAMVSRYAILGLHHYPELNARIEDDEIVMGGPVHLGFAAQTGRGLVVPVVAEAQACTLGQLSAALADRTRRARDSQLGPAELTGGTFTINNYGVFGVDGSAAIINHPEVAILGIGRIIERPWVVGGQVVARQVTQLTLAFDHRVCDGGTAGGFLRFVADCVESPARALRDM
jgi:pyruvate dehydrogenase E2 component (dihydrolipoamide acetyltransferase)